MPFRSQGTGSVAFGHEVLNRGSDETPQTQPMPLDSTIPHHQSQGTKKLSRKERYDKFEATETKNRGNN